MGVPGPKTARIPSRERWDHLYSLVVVWLPDLHAGSDGGTCQRHGCLGGLEGHGLAGGLACDGGHFQRVCLRVALSVSVGGMHAEAENRYIGR